MNKRIFMIALLVSGASAFGVTLEEKLASHKNKIQAMKQKARAGEILAAQDDCKGSGSGSGGTGGRCDGGGTCDAE